MKILLINLWQIIDAKGGTEKVFCNMANAMVERNHKVTAVCLENRGGEPFFALNENVNFINAGIGFKASLNVFQKLQTFLIMDKNKRDIYRDRIKDLQKAKKIEKIITEENPDVIISFNDSATRMLENSIKTRVPVISMFHTYPEAILKYATNDTIKALAKSRAIQVLMPSFKKIVVKYVKHGNIICIPNAVPQCESCNVLENKRIITVGRIDPIFKRQHLLIEAFALIRNKYPDWTLDIYGDISYNQDYYKYCCKLIGKYKLKDVVKFCGTTGNIKTKLLNSSVFAFPSAFEGFGLALAEAMSAGVPVIGYKNCTAVNELIKNGENGYLCEDGIEPLAQALDKLMSNKELRVRMGKVAKTDMVQFEPKKIWDMWEELMGNVMRNR